MKDMERGERIKPARKNRARAAAGLQKILVIGERTVEIAHHEVRCLLPLAP